MKWIIYVLLFLLVSCGKAFKTTVKGRVLNPVTGKGIPNIRVSLSKTTIGLPAGSEAVASVDTDENGNFEVSDRNFKSLRVGVSIDTYKYYLLGWYENGTYTSYLGGDKGNVVERDYHAVEYCDYQLTVRNVNCQSNSDSIVFNRQNEVGSFLNKATTLVGCVDHTYGSSRIPQGKITTQYTVIRNGVSTSYIDEFEVVPNAENKQVLEY